MTRQTRPLLSKTYARIAVFIIAYFVVALVLFIPVTVALLAAGVVNLDELQAMAEGDFSDSGAFLFAIAIATAAFGIAYTAAYVVVVEKKRPSDYGLDLSRGWLGNFLFWALVGAVVLGAIFVIELLAGLVDVTSVNLQGGVVKSLLFYFVLFALVAVSEEFMFRGYVMQAPLHNKTSPPIWTWVVISSIVFSLFHAINPGYSATGFLNTAIIGVGLCLMMFITQSLWAPIGFHFGWNLSLAWAYSLNVSGLDMDGVLDTQTSTNYTGLTGGEYGPEGGYICTAVVLGLTIALMPKAISRIRNMGSLFPWLGTSAAYLGVQTPVGSADEDSKTGP
jgi:membrane protease YdiL (CAAX protease family)